MINRLTLGLKGVNVHNPLLLLDTIHFLEGRNDHGQRKSKQPEIHCPQ